MPDGFFRPSEEYVISSLNGTDKALFDAHPIAAGANQGAVNTYTPDTNSADFSSPCKLYEDFVNDTIKGLYPDPTGALKDALKANIHTLFVGFNVSTPGCTEQFPYGM